MSKQISMKNAIKAVRIMLLILILYVRYSAPTVMDFEVKSRVEKKLFPEFFII